MQLLAIQQAMAASSILATMPQVIESVGRPGFSAGLFDIARRFTGTEIVTAFVTAPDGIVHTLLAENRQEPGKAALDVARRYVSRHWRADPANTIALDESSSRDCWGVRMRANDIANPSYRSECYFSVGLSERFSLIQRRTGGTMRLSIYRGRKESFSDQEIAHLVESAPLLMAALWRHYEAERPAEHRALPAFQARLAAVAPGLSKRERDVCALIASGLTSEGIALELGVGINTVLTYRKRAYARLGISSQNELMRILM
ncbi:helix-turn-helix transcriptional regulator [Bosea sp. AS-1]|uniref:helix-turn-helix transcriptional regulator n=1 Tax=Bosea sp. AS-1 TaxID=2015316 RepID=UPI000B7785B9|nr:helix-turn-helix transcriptional regulator [Bosea sp. AS-1]